MRNMLKNTNRQNAQKFLNLEKNVECEKKEVFNLSTLKNSKNVEKRRFSKSYSHYPHKKPYFLWITLVKKRTNVLVSYDENIILSKKGRKNVDF